uniref:Arrestin_N domain-containing protein n=1 Tax=Syphacia muris TaxID=451379 RepID=A0A158R589_9BILA
MNRNSQFYEPDLYAYFLDAGQDAVFHGGELISGFLKVQLKRPMTIEVIRLHFKGRGCFIERDGSKHEEKDKIYFDKNLTLLERPPGKPEPGHFPWIAEFMYSLPFEYTLPIGCPTSYEAVFGFIRYFVRAVIVEANTKIIFLILCMHVYFVAKQCFTVVAPSSGDEGIPESNPVTASEALTQGGCCCRAKICAEAQLQKSSTAVCGEEEPEVLRESEKVECSQESEKPEKKVEDTKNQESEVISQPAIRELNVDSSVTEEIGPFGPEFYETVVLIRTADVEMMPLGINEQSARQTVKES